MSHCSPTLLDNPESHALATIISDFAHAIVIATYSQPLIFGAPLRKLRGLKWNGSPQSHAAGPTKP